MTGYFPNFSLFHFPPSLALQSCLSPFLALGDGWRVWFEASVVTHPPSLVSRGAMESFVQIKVFSEQTLILLWLGRGCRTRSSQNLEATYLWNFDKLKPWHIDFLAILLQRCCGSMSQDTGGDIDEIPEEYLALRTEEAGKAAREALRIRSTVWEASPWNLDAMYGFWGTFSGLGNWIEKKSILLHFSQISWGEVTEIGMTVAEVSEGHKL